KYIFPPIDILGKKPQTNDGETKTDMIANAKKLEETLASFGVEAKVIQINKGPTVTRYELTPKQGVKVSKIVNLADDIALNLAAMGIRIEAPIPGKAAVGIEVPNKVTQSVYLRSVLDSDNFKKFPSKLAFALGEDIAGNAIVTDIAKMPHLLIAGATGSGKSVCINTLITSILYKADPKEVKLLMVDPKVVELSVYNGIPHLLIPVVTDPKKAAGALNWAVKEMLGRYQSFAEFSVRDIKGYNAMKEEKQETDLMPQIVVIIDELADLMMAAPGEVEDSICRLAQMARAAGIHLIIATQRPSVDVITGVIKANIPSRLAFAVSSGTDSRTILDGVGAEKLLGKGDMLFYPVGMSKPVRIQGAFVTDKEVEHIVDFVKRGKNTTYDTKMIETITASAKSAEAGSDSDEFFDAALDLVVEKQKGSTSMIQRQFRIGYNRAARIMEELEARGFVGPEDGSKPRKVLLTKMQLDEMRYPVNDDIND
ncbi:MAG: DNA translocase FtsK, partial [Anaerotignaceae bacterium]